MKKKPKATPKADEKAPDGPLTVVDFMRQLAPPRSGVDARRRGGVVSRAEKVGRLHKSFCATRVSAARQRTRLDGLLGGYSNIMEDIRA